MRAARPGPARLAQLTASDVVRRSASRTSRSPPACSARRRRRLMRPSSYRSTRRAPLDEKDSATSSFGDRRTGRSPGCPTVSRLELGSSRYSLRSSRNQPAVADRHLPAPGSNALQASSDVRATMNAASELPRRRRLRSYYDPTVFVRESIRAGSGRCSRRSAGGDRGGVVPPDLAASIIPLVAVPVSLIGTFAVMLPSASRSTRCRCSAWSSPSASSWTMRLW